MSVWGPAKWDVIGASVSEMKSNQRMTPQPAMTLMLAMETRKQRIACDTDG